jgi:sarcosine oxidase, subunit delta
MTRAAPQNTAPQNRRKTGSIEPSPPVQIFPCPFCGPRDESEFHYVGEPKARPEPAGAVSDAAWAEYLWFNANPKGEAREIWLHLTCMEMFAMTRDTTTNAVVGSEALTRPAP